MAASVAVAGLMVGCSDGGTSTGEQTLTSSEVTVDIQALGEPSESSIWPVVVPAVAMEEPSGPLGLTLAGTAYKMPTDVTTDQVVSWYAQHMPKGQAFRGYEWVEELPPDELFSQRSWIWCYDRSQTVEVAFDTGDDGDARVDITVAEVTIDDACESFVPPQGQASSGPP